MVRPAPEIVFGRDGENAVIVVTGSVDVSNAQQLEDAITTSGADTVIDFTGCDFIDSTGFSALMAGHRALIMWGRRATIACEPLDAFSRLLGVTGLARVLSVHPSRAEALAALRAEVKPESSI